MDLERDVELVLVDEVRKRGGLCIKHGQDGWPDRLVVLPKRGTIWVELKRKDGELAPLQVYRRQQLHKAGAEVVVAYSKEQVKEFLDGFTRE